jgi:hypothetical protein
MHSSRLATRQSLTNFSGHAAGAFWRTASTARSFGLREGLAMRPVGRPRVAGGFAARPPA